MLSAQISICHINGCIINKIIECVTCFSSQQVNEPTLSKQYFAVKVSWKRKGNMIPKQTWNESKSETIKMSILRQVYNKNETSYLNPKHFYYKIYFQECLR